MTQKVSIEFIGNASFGGVISEIKRMQAALASMQNMQGPAAVNKQLSQSMQIMAGNVNAMSNMHAGVVKLDSASETFSHRLRQNSFQLSELGSIYRATGGRQNQFAQGMKKVAAEQMRFRNSGFISAMQNMNGQMTGMAVSTDMYQGSLLKNVQTQELFRRAQFQSAQAMKSLGTNVVNMGKNMQWAGRQITVGVTVPLAAFMAITGKLAYNIDKELTRIVKVYDFTGDSSADAMDRIKESSIETAREVSQQFGIMEAETLKVIAAFAQMGFQGEQLQEMARLTMRTSMLGEVDVEDSQRLVRTLANGFETLDGIVGRAGRNMSNVSTVLDRFNIVENETILSTADLAQELPDLAGTLNAVGLSGEFGAAALAGMAEQGLNVNESQTALRTSLIRVISPTAKAVKVWKDFAGVDLTALVSETEDTEQVILKLSNILGGIEDNYVKTSLMDALFDNRNAGRMLQLFSQVDGYSQGIENSFATAAQTLGVMGEEGMNALEAFQRSEAEAQAQRESSAGKLDIIRAKIMGGLAEIGAAMLPVVEFVAGLVEGFTSFINKMPSVLTTIVGVVAAIIALSGPLLMLKGVAMNIFGQGIITMASHLIRKFQEFRGETEVLTSMQDSLQKRLLTGKDIALQQAQGIDTLNASMKALRDTLQQNVARPALDPYTMAESKTAVSGHALLQKIKNSQATNALQIKAQKNILVGEKDVLKVAKQNLAVAESKVKAKTKERDVLRQIEASQKATAKSAKEVIAAETLRIKRLQTRLAIQREELSDKIGGGAKKTVRDRAKLAVVLTNDQIAASEKKLAAAVKEQAAARTASTAAGKAAGIAGRELGGLTAQRAMRMKELAAAQGAVAKTQALLVKLNNNTVQSEEKRRRTVELLERQYKRLQAAQVAESQAAVGGAGKAAAAEASRLQRMRAAFSGKGFGAGIAATTVGSAFEGSENKSVAAAGKLASSAGQAAMAFSMMPGYMGAVLAAVTLVANYFEEIVDYGKDLLGIVEETSGFAETFADTMTLKWNEFGTFELNDNLVQTRAGLAAQIAAENDEFIKEIQSTDDVNRKRVLIENFGVDMQQAGNSAEDVYKYMQGLLDASGLQISVDEVLVDITKVDQAGARIRSRLEASITGGYLDSVRSEVANFANAILMEDYDFAQVGFNVTTELLGGLRAAATQSSEEDFPWLDDFMNQFGLDVEEAKKKIDEMVTWSVAENAGGGGRPMPAAMAEMAEFLRERNVFLGQLQDARSLIFEHLEAGSEAEQQMVEQLKISAGPYGHLIDVTKSYAEAVGVVINGLGAGEAAQTAYRAALVRGATALGLTGRELDEYAVAAGLAAAGTDGLGAAANGTEEDLEGLAEAAARGKAWLSNFKSEMQALQDDVIDAGMDALQATIDARLKVFDAQSDAMRDAQEAETDALKDAQEEQTDALQDSLEARKDAIEAHEEAEIERIESTRDAHVEAKEEQIEALDQQQDKEDELEQRRQQIFEAEKRRQEYLRGQRSSAISFSVALATGDVESAAKIREEMLSAESDYGSAEAEAARERELAATEKARAAEKTQLEASIEQTEEAADAELDAIESTKEAALKALEEEKDAREKALRQRHEAEEDALRKSQELQQENLKNAREAYQEEASARKDALQESLQALKDFTPQNLEELQGWVEQAAAKITVGVPGSFGTQVLEQAGLYGDALHNEFTAGVDRATAQLAESERWDALGESVGAAFGRGMSGDMSLAEIISSITKGPAPAFHAPGAGPQEFHSGGYIPSGSGLQQESMIRAQQGEFVLNRGAVRNIGLSNVNRLNQAGQGGAFGMRNDGTYHTGGLVGGLVNAAASMGGAALAYAGQNLGSLSAETVGKLDTNFARIMGSTGSSGQALKAFDHPTLTAEQDKVAAEIWNAGLSVGANAKQMIAAFMTAFVESGMRNVNYGDRDSLGVFQQRPSMAWGSAEQIMSVPFAARSFFLGRGTNPGALTVDQSGTPGQLAQRVQRSAFPGRYDERLSAATSIMDFISSIGGGQLAGGANSFSGLFGGYPGSAEGTYEPGVSTGYGRGPSGAGFGNIVDIGRAIQAMGARVTEHPAFGGVRYKHAAGGHHYSNTSGTGGDAIDINYGPGGENAQEKAWMDNVLVPWVNKNLVNYRQFLWRVPGHFNHAHLGGGDSQFSMPQLAVGGNIKYDNTIANLHRGETVLTAPLTEKLNRGIDQIAGGSSGNTFHIYPSEGMDELDLARKIQRVNERTLIRQGARPNGKF